MESLNKKTVTPQIKKCINFWQEIANIYVGSYKQMYCGPMEAYPLGSSTSGYIALYSLSPPLVLGGKY